MPLRYRLEQQSETLLSFELASHAKYLEGYDLMFRGYGGAGMYLMGYSAEMLLKTAYFRYSGAQPSDRISALLAPAQQTAKRLIPGVSPEGNHSLRYWALLLRAKRSQRNHPLPGIIDASFVSRTRRLHQNWWVGMRYRPDSSEPLEVLSLRDDVDWLRANHGKLWR
jgi:hypothetical protein